MGKRCNSGKRTTATWLSWPRTILLQTRWLLLSARTSLAALRWPILDLWWLCSLRELHLLHELFTADFHRLWPAVMLRECFSIFIPGGQNLWFMCSWVSRGLYVTTVRDKLSSKHDQRSEGEGVFIYLLVERIRGLLLIILSSDVFGGIRIVLQHTYVHYGHTNVGAILKNKWPRAMQLKENAPMTSILLSP